MRELTDHHVSGKAHVNRVFANTVVGHRVPSCYEYTIDTGDGKIVFHFQNGPIAETGVNGIQNEDLLVVVIDRLRSFQNSQFACRENAIALTKLEEALMWLKKRTESRITRGVEGSHQV